jgi:hypothetical protein
MVKEQYSKEIFDIDIGWIRDRTKTIHKYPYDVDVRSPSAPPEKRHWIYWGSHRSIEKCRSMIGDKAQEVKRLLGDPKAEARIVEAKTGKILEVIK